MSHPHTPEHDSSNRATLHTDTLEDRITRLESLMVKVLASIKRREAAPKMTVEEQKASQYDENLKAMHQYILSRKHKGCIIGEIAARLSRIERTQRAQIYFDLLDSGKIVSIESKGRRGPTGKRIYAVEYQPPVTPPQPSTPS